MTLFLVTNGTLQNGYIFTNLNTANNAMLFCLPGETLTMYTTEVEFAAVDENGVVCVEGGAAVDVCEWHYRTNRSNLG